MVCSVVDGTANTTWQQCVGPVPPHIHPQDIETPPASTKETAVASKRVAAVVGSATGIIREETNPLESRKHNTRA